jgi:acyl carrier protein
MAPESEQLRSERADECGDLTTASASDVTELRTELRGDFFGEARAECFRRKGTTEMMATNDTMTARSRDDLLSMFRTTATEVVEKDFHFVLESTVIGELGIDSLGMLEIIGSMERQLKIQIPDESLSGIETIKDLLEVVEKRMAS